MSHRIIVLIIIQLVLFLLDAVASDVQFDQKTLNYFLKSGEPGILTAFSGVPEMNGSLLKLSYNLKANKFAGDFLIVNKTGEMIDLNIIGIVNYGQVPFKFDRINDNQHPLILDSNETERSKVSFENLSNGANDLIFIAMDRTDDLLEKKTESVNFYFHRIELFVGSSQKPEITFKTANSEPSKAGSTYYARLGQKKRFSINSGHSPLKFQKPMTTFYLHINNAEKTRLNIAVLSFINGKQISSLKNHSPNALFWHIPPNSMGTIPIEVDTRIFKDGDFFTVLYIENPYINLETKNSEMTKERIRVEIPFRGAVHFN